MGSASFNHNTCEFNYHAGGIISNAQVQGTRSSVTTSVVQHGSTQYLLQQHRCVRDHVGGTARVLVSLLTTSVVQHKVVEPHLAANHQLPGEGSAPASPGRIRRVRTSSWISDGAHAKDLPCKIFSCRHLIKSCSYLSVIESLWENLNKCKV